MTPFSPQQTATLRAAIDRIIPPDDYPSGWEAGVGDYLARQLAGDLASVLDTYQSGLDQLDIAAQATAGADFADLTPDAQDALLTAIEAGAQGDDLARFFRLLVAHTMEGYYGDPGNGGNRDQVAWRMIGFEVRG
jgi:hypothetical protein